MQKLFLVDQPDSLTEKEKMTMSEDWQLSKCHLYKQATSILTQIWASSRGSKLYVRTE